MNIIRIFAAGVAGLFLTAPATAKTVDQYGVVVFTQADVDAGGITLGDTPGFPASILVSGSYRLASPLTLPSLKNGIVISAPAVTLDLGGFKVSGAAVGRNGIYSDQIDTTVMNGIVRGFTENGILSTAGFLTIERVKVTNNGRNGIDDYAGNGGSRITDSHSSGNGSFGIYCGPGCLVQGNTVSNNGASGVSIFSKGSVLGNVIYGNGSNGIVAFDTGYGNNTIVGNGIAPAAGTLIPLQPNACSPACPVPAP